MISFFAESIAITNGHKAELFVLAVSFIGWGLLCGITMGIAAIWVVPYMEATFANAYNSLKPQVVIEESNYEMNGGFVANGESTID